MQAYAMTMLYRVTKVLGDTAFVDLKMKFAPEGQTGGDFIYSHKSHFEVNKSCVPGYFCHPVVEEFHLELCRLRFPKNYDFDSLAVFSNLSGIGTRIAIKKELFTDSLFPHFKNR